MGLQFQKMGLQFQKMGLRFQKIGLKIQKMGLLTIIRNHVLCLGFLIPALKPTSDFER